jgi:hypothetical protein
LMLLLSDDPLVAFAAGRLVAAECLVDIDCRVGADLLEADCLVDFARVDVVAMVSPPAYVMREPIAWDRSSAVCSDGCLQRECLE